MDNKPLWMRGSSIQRPKGPLCKLCQKPCAEPVWDEKGRGPYCSGACHTDDTKGLSQKQLRDIAWERDQGVCAAPDCLVRDTKAVLAHKAAFATEALWIKWASKLYGFTEAQLKSGVLWEADHIRERARGGKDAPENIQTLCRICHGKKSSEFTSQRFRKRGLGRGR